MYSYKSKKQILFEILMLQEKIEENEKALRKVKGEAKFYFENEIREDKIRISALEDALNQKEYSIVLIIIYIIIVLALSFILYQLLMS